ncbi:MAG TPA: hypothetical protein VFI13_03475 [Gemmatimonadales bacterium]|nr:hypothetical protein [Gemmatimonadales bacterium]
MSQHVPMVRTLFLAFLVVAPARLLAQDPFEFEVFTPATAAPGETELGINTNYVATGNKAFDGPFAPTEHQTRLAIEVGHGLTKSVEVAAYALLAKPSDASVDWAGWRLRTRVRAPDAWRLPVRLGVNVEVEGTDIRYGEHHHALEIAPIVAWARGPVALTFDAPFARGLDGTGKQEFEFEPKASASVAMGRAVTLTTEYYNSPEDAGGLGPELARRQMVIPGAVFLFGDDFRWNVGVGFGLTSTTDDLVIKTGVEFPLHE